jgi:predicted dehydrogenase
MDTYGVGVIGYGFIGKVHTYAHQTMRYYYEPVPLRTRLVGVCTSRRATADAAKEHGGFDFATDDPAEILAREDIRIVHICTPNDSHARLVMEALRAGKAVYCDKPLCLSAAEAVEIVAALERHPVPNQMTFHNRFVPATLRAKQLMASGALGRIFHYRAQYLHAGYIDPERPMSWRMDLERSGGGALYDLGSHVIDLMRWLAGEIRSVRAELPTLITSRPVAKGSAERRVVKVDDIALLSVRTDEAYGLIEASRLATGANDALRFEIHGENGALRFDSEEPSWLHHYDGRRPSGDLGGDVGYTKIECVQRYPAPASWPGPKFAPGWLRFHVACLHEFLSSIAEGRQAEPSLLEGARTQMVLQAALDSAAAGGNEVEVAQAGVALS